MAAAAVLPSKSFKFHKNGFHIGSVCSGREAGSPHAFMVDVAIEINVVLPLDRPAIPIVLRTLQDLRKIFDALANQERAEVLRCLVRDISSIPTNFS